MDWLDGGDRGPGLEGSREKILEIVEKWPNGNLRMTGRKAGDHNVGRWAYYNEQGDRIRELDFDKGGSISVIPTLLQTKGWGSPR